MSYIAERFQGKKAGLSLDTDALSRYRDLIDLSIGDTDLITDERIIAAAFRDASAGYTRYGRPKGDPELLSAIQKAWQEDFSMTIPDSELLITTSSCMGMQLSLLSILNPGDEVIVLAPYFGVYRQQIELAGGVCIEVASSEKDDWGLDEAALRKAVTPKTRAVIFNNPVNPTGHAYSMHDMHILAEIAGEYDLLILADEIYTRYFFEGKYIPMRSLDGMARRTVTLHSFSKNFMMTGWRVGYIIAPEEITETVNMLNGGMTYTTPSISQRAAIEALKHREDIREKYISRYASRVHNAAKRIQEIPYFTLCPPKGTFYLFPGITKTGLDSQTFCREILEKCHVLVTPGTAFGGCGEGYIRIACTAPDEAISEAFDRLKTLNFQ